MMSFGSGFPSCASTEALRFRAAWASESPSLCRDRATLRSLTGRPSWASVRTTSFTEKTPNARVEKGKLWVSGEFLTAHATKLGGSEPAVPPVQEPDEAEIRLIREEIAREQAGSELVVREREWRESLERLEVSGFRRIRGFLAKPLGDGWIELARQEFYKEAQERVSSGFQDNWKEKCHLITGGDVREVKRLPDLDSVAGVQVHVRRWKLRPRTDYKALVKAPQAATHTGVLIVTGTFVSLAQGRQSRHVLIVLPSIAAETERRESFCACRSSWLFSGHDIPFFYIFSN